MSYPVEPCPTYHVHDDESWEWGATCNACRSPSFVEKSTRYSGVRFNVRHLKAQNQRGYTVREEVAEIYEGARERGADIMRA